MDVKRIAKTTRWYRKLHRLLAVSTFVFFFLISVTGLLLGWKKHSGGRLLADTHAGVSHNLSDWLPFDSLASIAVHTIQTKAQPGLSTRISRIDARPGNGMVKVLFEDHFQAVQIDATNGNVLLLEQRNADFIEQLHDGSFFDRILGTGQTAKLSYTTITGLSLLLLTISGFWLWYNPRRIKKLRQNS